MSQKYYEFQCKNCKHVWLLPWTKPTRMPDPPSRLNRLAANLAARGDRASFGRGLGKGELQLLNVNLQQARADAARANTPTCPNCGSRAYKVKETRK